MPKQMSGKTFSNLLDYYIACLKYEDMLSVTFNVSSEGTAFLSTLFQTEMLFHTNNKKVSIKNADDVKKFFQTSLLRQNNNTLFYGYPVIIGPEGAISPLFYIELHYEDNGDTCVFTNLSTHLKLNHYILSQQKYSPEEITQFRQEIEEEDFASALASVCKILHFRYTDCSATLDEKPFKRTITQKLVNKAILYFGQHMDITHNLITELLQLKNKPIDTLASTSLFLLLTNQYPTEKTKPSIHPLLEIFSLNNAQENAVQRSLEQPLTVITGPPGTGKSQVVLNIIANAVYRNKTILFASKNNKAVDVVIQKLNMILPYTLLVRMGHQAHRRNAKSQLEQLIKQPIQKPPSKQKTHHDLVPLISQIQNVQEQIMQLTLLNESIDSLQSIIDILQEEYPNDKALKTNQMKLQTIDPVVFQEDLKKIFSKRSILHTVYPERQKKKQERFFRKYYDVLPHHLKEYLQNKISNENITRETILQWILSWRKKQLALEELQKLRTTLLTIPPYTILKNKLTVYHNDYRTISQIVFKDHWINIFAEAQDKEKQHIVTYFSLSEQLESWKGSQSQYKQLQTQRIRMLQQILKILPVWVVTNLSAKQSFPLKNCIFDILIIDEASQCDIVSALPLFYRANHVVIIGDPYQLRHISLIPEQHDKELAEKNNIDEDLYKESSYTKNSLYDFAEKITKKNNDTPLLLNEHYRCHPDIVSFSNEYYYEKKLTISTDETRLLHHPTLQRRILWQHVKGKTIHSKSPYNEVEAERVVEETLRILELVSSVHASIGIVTLFRAQTEIITEKLQKFQDLFDCEITIGTAHRFQGDEKDIILFSPAVSEGVKPGTLHWIQTTNQLLNVAVTRARSLFIVVGDQDVCGHSTGPLKNLSDYVEMTKVHKESLDSPAKQILYEALKKDGLPVLTNYLLQATPTVLADFVLFVNNNRYVIQLHNEQKNLDRTQFNKNGWKFRRFSENDIVTKLQDVLEEIKRMC
ncbi:MAG: AAA family ATPase [Candidatus Thermoplasmatota archaeon]|nr:AAA family ATPase [Candidatus Thermoplasmatota archaeon]